MAATATLETVNRRGECGKTGLPIHRTLLPGLGCPLGCGTKRRRRRFRYPCATKHETETTELSVAVEEARGLTLVQRI